MDQHISSLFEAYQISRGGILVQVVDCSALNEEETVQVVINFMQRVSTRRERETEMEVEQRPSEELEEGEPSGKKRKVE